MSDNGTRFAAYDVDLMNVLEAINDNDLTAVSLGIAILHEKFCKTDVDTLKFLTWLIANYSLTYFEILEINKFKFDQARIDRELATILLEPEFNRE